MSKEKPFLLQAFWLVPIITLALALGNKFGKTQANVDALDIYKENQRIKFEVFYQKQIDSLVQIIDSIELSLSSPIEEMGFAEPVFIDNGVGDYIERFGPLAQREMAKYRIPASILIAHAMIKSNIGQARAARIDNNHFGELFSGQVFESSWRSWRDHSLFIMTNHPTLLELSLDAPYETWAVQFQQHLYPTDPMLARELINTIRKYDLYQLDELHL